MSTDRVQNATSLGDLHYHDTIDLRELLALREALRDRTRCDYCGERAHETPEGFIVHTEDDDANCYDENGLLDTGATLSDMLDADEAALLAELDRFNDDEVHGDLDLAHSTEPILIHADYFEKYARAWADSMGLVPAEDEGGNPLLQHIDWASWARELAADYYDVELAGTTFLRRG